MGENDNEFLTKLKLAFEKNNLGSNIDIRDRKSLFESFLPYAVTNNLSLEDLNKDNISLGDVLSNEILREKIFSILEDPTIKLPLFTGITNDLDLIYSDLSNNTAMVIAGNTGSGKTHYVMSMIRDLAITNSPKDVNVLLFDIKNSENSKEISKLPHIIGYHNNLDDIFNIVSELRNELDYRKKVLEHANKENWSSLRDLISKNNSDLLEEFPWLIVILDELTSVMSQLEKIAIDTDFQIYEKFKNDLATLAQEGRALGIKLVSVGQRTTDNSIPKNVLINSSLKLLFTLDENDYLRVLNNKVDKNNLPSHAGEALFTDFVSFRDSTLIDVITLGGNNDDQILNVIKAITLDWNRRILDWKFENKTTLKAGYNRDLLRKDVLDKLNNPDWITCDGLINENIKNLMDFIKTHRDSK